MSNSLRDQLLKAGLASTQQAKKVEHEKRQRQRDNNRRRRGSEEQTSEAKRLAEQAAQAQREKAKALNAEQAAAKAQKEHKARIRALIEKNEQQPGKGDLAYNFTHEDKIKHIYVTNAQHRELTHGQLAIVFFGRRYHLVPAATAEKLAKVAPELYINRNTPPRKDEEDPYADFPVPDDLMW